MRSVHAVERRTFPHEQALEAAESIARGFYGPDRFRYEGVYSPPDALLVFGSVADAKLSASPINFVHDVDFLAIVNDSRITTPDDLPLLLPHVRRFEQIENAYRVREVTRKPVDMDFLVVSSRLFGEDTDGSEESSFGYWYKRTFDDYFFMQTALRRGVLAWNNQRRRFELATIEKILPQFLSA